MSPWQRNLLLSTNWNCHHDIHKCWHICHLGKGINFLLWHLISWNISLPSSQSKYYICTRTEIHSIFIIPICHSVPILIHIRRKYCPKLLYEEEWPREIYHSSMTCKKKFAGLEKENWKLFPLLLSCSSFSNGWNGVVWETMERKYFRSERADINQALATTRLVKTIDGNTKIVGKLNYWWEHKNIW